MSLAAILSTFAAVTAGYFRDGGRWPKDAQPQAATLRLLTLLLAAGLVAGLVLAAAALGWPAGIGLWLAAAMVAGVIVVSLAAVRPRLALQLGLASASGAVLLAAAQWGAS